MKAQLMRISVGIIGLGVLLYFLACSPTTPNNNSSQNQSLAPNQNQANAESTSVDLDKPCDDYGSGHGNHAKEIKDKIEAKMGPSLKRLLKDQAHPNGTFTVEVQKATNGKYYVAYIKGKISGDDNLKELSDILNDFQSKKDCLRVIYFLPSQTSVTTDGGSGFEWISCEFPMVVCPNGECCMPTVDPGPQSTPSPTNTNANANRP
jgi:hypothetical protein